MSPDNNVKIFDCVNFYNEHQLFDLRYQLLKNLVDYFVIVEIMYYFNKKKKGFNFIFKKYKKKKKKIIKI